MQKTIYDEAYRTIIHKIKDRRRELNYTQEDLALKIGKNQKFISRIEIYAQKLDIVELYEICSLLELDIISIIEKFKKEINERNGKESD